MSFFIDVYSFIGARDSQNLIYYTGFEMIYKKTAKRPPYRDSFSRSLTHIHFKPSAKAYK